MFSGILGFGLAVIENHQMDYLNRKFQGEKSFERYSGHGRLELADGSWYEGEFYNGQFHGNGTLHLKDGRMEGVWVDGVQIESRYIFHNGLEYQSENWKYCCENDRRFYSEISVGIRPAGDLQYHDSNIDRSP
uniref:MORN repeat-containing protein 5 n=1 Tax=Albugo laibachii Nc14 TaxID=890382 RepID=F0WBX3_9STRA|nr:conserved hypothetical protein [Albugo laibachii Nc14]|eukprot:CCA18652.1 conserved hypothetical protein [Albugo laibachii Nc14]